MARRRQGGDDASESKNPRITKRKPREGVKRALNLVMLDANATRLEGLAVLCRSSPAEVVQDLVEAVTWRMRLTVPEVGGVVGRGVGEVRKPTPQELLQLLIESVAQTSDRSAATAEDNREEGVAAA